MATQTARTRKTATTAQAKAKKEEQMQAEIQQSTSEQNTSNTDSIIDELLRSPEAKEKLVKLLFSDSSKNDGAVSIICAADVANGYRLPLGENGKFGWFSEFGQPIEVTEKDFRSDLRDTYTRHMLDTRQYIVGEGLSDEERKKYNVLYSDGEILTTEMFDKILDMGAAALGEMFSKLTPEHKKIVCSKFIDAALAGDERATREKVLVLDDEAKKAGNEKMFSGLVKKVTS